MWLHKFSIFISAFSLILVVSLVSVGSPAQAAQCPTGQALCDGVCRTISSTVDATCGGAGTGHTYSDRCGTCSCAVNLASCSLSTPCVLITACDPGTTFAPCANSGLGACTTPYILRNPSIAQGNYITVRGGEAVETATSPEGSLFYNETRRKLRVRTDSTGAATDWEDVDVGGVGGGSYTSGRNIDTAELGANRIAVVGNPGFDQLAVSGNAVLRGNLELVGNSSNISIGSDQAIQVRPPSRGGAHLLVQGQTNATEGAGVVIQSASTASISELILRQGVSAREDRWALSARAPSSNFEIWRNNAGWTPALTMAYTNGAVTIPTRLRVGSAAPQSQEGGVGIEGNVTVSGKYRNPNPGTAGGGGAGIAPHCPSGSYWVDLNADGNMVTRGPGSSPDTDECYEPPTNSLFILVGGELRAYSDVQFLRGLTLGTTREHLNTAATQLSDYLVIRNMDNDAGGPGANPAEQYAIKVEDEGNNNWFSVRRAGYELESGITPVVVSTVGNVTAGGVVQGNRVYAMTNESSSGVVFAQGRLIASSLVVNPGANTLSSPGAGFVFDVAGNSRFLEDLTVLGDLRLGSRSVVTASRGVFNSISDDITSSTEGGILKVGGGAQFLRLDRDEISTNGSWTLNLQEHSTGPVRIHSALHVNGIITAGSSFASVPLTDIGGSLKMAELADEDWNEGAEGRLIIGTQSGVSCTTICGRHGLRCDDARLTNGGDPRHATWWNAVLNCGVTTETRYCWCRG